jgi:hypothetical protein
LEDELDDANKEIAHLNMLLNQSPAQKAMEKAKEMSVEMLEMEKEELLERVKALRTTMTEATTPHKIINSSGISPTPSCLANVHHSSENVRRTLGRCTCDVVLCRISLIVLL